MWSEAVTLHSDAGKKLPMMPACGVWGQTEHLGRLAVPEKQARVPLIMTSAVSARWKTPGRIFEGQKNITSKKTKQKVGVKKKKEKKGKQALSFHTVMKVFFIRSFFFSGCKFDEYRKLSAESSLLVFGLFNFLFFFWVWIYSAVRNTCVCCVRSTGIVDNLLTCRNAAQLI